MDSSAPSTSASDSSGPSDVRTGEGLAVEEIMRMKERRLRLLDDYRNDQEENISPLMREAEDINRKRKKKRSQRWADNNTPLRRSERIMTQTLNGNRTLESPMHQPQNDPEFEPEPAPEAVLELEPAPEAVLELEPAPEAVLELEPAPEAVLEPEPVPMHEYEPLPESEPNSDTESDLESEPSSDTESDLESDRESQSESTSGPTLESETITESDLESELMSESEPDSEAMPESEREAEVMPESEPEFELMPDPEPVVIPIPRFAEQYLRGYGFGAGFLNIRRYRRMVQRWLPVDNSLRLELINAMREMDDTQLVSRRLFAVHPLPGQMNVPPLTENSEERVPDYNSYGPREGINVGHHWNTRLECSKDGIHRPAVAGIHAGPEGAYSVALSGTYPEDIDEGNVVIFTGAGGRDFSGVSGRTRSMSRAPQIRDQELNKANLSLIRSMNTGYPVRLIRGYRLASSYAPSYGYRYDGLYQVVHYSYTVGHAGYRVFKFKMTRMQPQEPAPWEIPGIIFRNFYSDRDDSPSPPSWSPSPPPSDPSPPTSDPSPPTSDPSPPPSDNSPPPSDNSPPPSDNSPPPSEPTQPSRKRARVQNNGLPGTAKYGELDNEIGEHIRKLCLDSSYVSGDDDQRPLMLFRGWNI